MATLKVENGIARLRRTEDGSVSAPKVELYCLMVADGVSETASWSMTFAGPKGHLPSGTYLSRMKASPVVRARIAELIGERDRLMASGDMRDQMLWQANQLWRRGAAMNDVRLMERATTLLFDLEKRINPAPKAEKPEPSERGRGAPTVEMPVEEGYSPGAAAMDKLLTK